MASHLLTVQFGIYTEAELTQLIDRLENLLGRRGNASMRGLLAEALQELFTEALAGLETLKKGASDGDARSP